MNPLADTLERFNRKERNLLIRDILDCWDRTPPLGPVFCKRLAEVVEISEESLNSAWWATDFHFDWLAGALLNFMKGKTPQCNTPMPANAKKEDEVRLVMGNQEDIDLVVVAHEPAAKTYHLILFEAKAYGHFDKIQYKRKINRLKLLYAFYTGLKKDLPQESESRHDIVFHYVAYSPTEPQLQPLRLPWQSNVATEPKHTYLRLRLPGSSILTVTRCHANGLPRIEGAHWKCEPLQSSRRSGTP
jgi:hypothetical protein